MRKSIHTPVAEIVRRATLDALDLDVPLHDLHVSSSFLAYCRENTGVTADDKVSICLCLRALGFDC